MELSERWFEDWTVGEVFDVPERHVMDGERMLAFAREFDPQRFHVDAEAARETIYGGLIASGWHTGSVLMKLLTTTLGPASLGSPGGQNLRWLAPVRAGDELRLRITVLDVKASSSKPDRGIVTCRHELCNQDGQVVMSFEPAMMTLRRPTGD